MSRRLRPHYRPATVGYRASRCQARSPRQAGLTGLHFRSVLRFASGFHPTRPRGEGLGCHMPTLTPCSCLRLMVASNRPHKGLAPPIIHPCPTHLRSGYALAPQAAKPGSCFLPLGHSFLVLQSTKRVSNETLGRETMVMPASCLGGIPALAAEYSDIPLIAVTENQTVLQVTNERMQMRNVIEVDSYLEAAGTVLALREGISLQSLRRPLHCSQRIDLPNITLRTVVSGERLVA
jgi:hypothetical protein